MLSKGAWNAFLKTLEEPPSHAVFVLATTELEKVPETVQSRCQVFEFKKPSRAALAKMVAAVAKKEGYTLEKDAAELVAMLAGGSYRDALSVLQKVLASAEGTTLARASVEEATGTPRQEQVHALVSALAKGDRALALKAVGETAVAGADMKLFLELVLGTLRSALLIRYAPEMRDTLAAELGEDEFAALEQLGSPTSKLTHATMLAFLTAADRIRFAPIPAIPLELAILELFPE